MPNELSSLSPKWETVYRFRLLEAPYPFYPYLYSTVVSCGSSKEVWSQYSSTVWAGRTAAKHAQEILAGKAQRTLPDRPL